MQNTKLCSENSNNDVKMVGKHNLKELTKYLLHSSSPVVFCQLSVIQISQ